MISRFGIGRSMAGLLIAACLFMVSGCAPSRISTGKFVDVSALGAQLKRGASTKIDVQRALGIPSGMGGALFPTVEDGSEVWLYDDIEVTDHKGESDGTIKMSLRQQVLLVFFRKQRFDGFFWYSSSMRELGQ